MWTQAKVHRLEGRRSAALVNAPPLRTPLRGTISLLIVAIVGLWFLNHAAFRYFTLDRDTYGIYWPRRDWVLAHILAGTVAIMLGPVQLWFGLNRKSLLLHRVLGILYVASVGFGSVAAFRLAVSTDFGWVFGMGLIWMAVAWILTTGLATVAICRKQISQHREWMLRSYFITFGFVVFRVTVDVLETAHVGTMTERLTAASWFCWSVPLLIAEGVIQGRKLLRT